MNNLLFIIVYTAMAAWLLPPFKQYRTKFLLYFALLGASDPLSEITNNLWLLSTWEYYFLFSSLSIISLLELKIKKWFLTIAAILSTIIITFFEFNNETLHSIVAFNILLTVIIIAKLFIVNIRETEKINLFFIMLLMYNISNVIKIIFSINHGKTGYLYFFVTNIFQIFIAIYFTMYNVENSKKFSLFRDVPGKA